MTIDRDTLENGAGGRSWLARLKSLFGRSDQPTLRDNIAAALEEQKGTDSGFSVQERLMLNNILRFRGVRIDDVMVPRADILAVEETTPIGDVIAVFRQAGHSRLPVYRDTLDEPVGMVHIKDLMGWMTRKARARRNGGEKAGIGANPMPANGAGIDLSRVDLTKPLKSAKILRKALFVPPSMRAVELLLKMQATRLHMALVVDEYGGTEGLASIEDLIEEIVGEIEDEHDMDQAPKISKAEDGSYIADARVLIEDFQALLGEENLLEVAEEDVETLGGLVFSIAGRVPVRGELIACPQNFEFEILEADQRRIKKIRARVKTGRAALDQPTRKQKRNAD